MMWAKCMFREDKHWQVGICLPLPRPVTLPWKIQGAFHVTVKQALIQSFGRKLKRQTVDTALVFTKAMAQDGPVFTFT